MAKALSTRQPWLELILQGRKTIEVRTWKTRYRGPLLLHSSRAVDPNACQRFGLEPDCLTVGAIIGLVTIVDCLAFTEASWSTLSAAHLNTGGFRPGLMAWVLREPQKIQPISFRGRLGLFEVPDHLVSGLRLTQHGYIDRVGVRGLPVSLDKCEDAL